jgi:phage terminase large subunit
MYNDMRRDMRRDPDKFKHIWGGGYQLNSNARVFSNWIVDDVPVPNENTFLLNGADFGFSIDPTVIVSCYVLGKKLFVWREAYKVGCEIVHTPLLFDQCTPEHGMLRRWTIIADSARPETISHLKHHGYPLVERSVKGPGSVKEGIEFLKSYDIVVDPSCIHTIDELTSYNFKIDPRTGMVTRELSDKKNHVIDALRYAVEPLRRPRGGLV